MCGSAYLSIIGLGSPFFVAGMFMSSHLAPSFFIIPAVSFSISDGLAPV